MLMRKASKNKYFEVGETCTNMEFVKSALRYEIGEKCT